MNCVAVAATLLGCGFFFSVALGAALYILFLDWNRKPLQRSFTNHVLKTLRLPYRDYSIKE